jgi:hypothetical protein
VTQTLLAADVSVFRGSTNTTPIERVSLHTMLERIRDGAYARETAQLRAILARGDKARYRQAKEQSLAFTPGCALTTRAKEVSWNEKLVSVSSIANFDTDGVSTPEALKAILAQDPHIAYTFVSPSAQGLKIGVFAPDIADHITYKYVWHSILTHLQQQYPDVHLRTDQHVKFLHALCYVSHDPALYMNPNAVPFVVPPPAPKRTRAARAPLPGTDYTAVASPRFRCKTPWKYYAYPMSDHI